MYLGKIVEIGPPDELYSAPGHPYTRALLSAVPVPDPVGRAEASRIILKGDVPSPINPPSGCRFHTRCWLYERLGQPEICRTIDPPLTAVAGLATHNAACHYADEALKTDVGIAHLGDVMVRRGTPAAAIASLESGKDEGPTEEQIAAFAAPAFADLGKEATEVQATEGLSGEDPNALNTPSDRAEFLEEELGHTVSSSGNPRASVPATRPGCRSVMMGQGWPAGRAVPVDGGSRRTAPGMSRTCRRGRGGGRALHPIARRS